MKAHLSLDEIPKKLQEASKVLLPLPLLGSEDSPPDSKGESHAGQV